jgi:hypothetical protein
MVIFDFIYTPQLEQLVELHPVQDEAPADALTVSPPLPLLTKPHEDIRRLTFLLPQAGQVGLSLPMIKISNFLSHFSQLYS